MQKDSNVLHGVKWGIIIGIVYCLIIFFRYERGADNPIFFGLFTMFGFVVVLILLLISGFQRRKALGGYIELKEIFQSLFVSVLILELFYTIFNFVYLKSIDPDFFQKLYNSTEAMMHKQGIPQDKIDKQLESLDVNTAQKLTASSVIVSYLYSVAITGVFALIFSLIIKKTRPPFQNDQQNIFQTQQ
jgi:hypothetical protein